MGIHIVLFEPEIPANTGNIARTCVATNSTLHLIHPLGFSTDDKMVKRAGLDYWKHLRMYEYESLEKLFEKYQQATFYFVEDYGNTYYTELDYSAVDVEQFFIFGKETTGIPLRYLEANRARCIRIPASTRVRSLNLSNAAAIVLYEVLRQQNFQGTN